MWEFESVTVGRRNLGGCGTWVFEPVTVGWPKEGDNVGVRTCYSGTALLGRLWEVVQMFVNVTVGRQNLVGCGCSNLLLWESII